MKAEEGVARNAAWEGQAPAKVNLRLRILARETSGFHQLETVFQAVALADRIELSVVPEPGVFLEVTGVPEGSLGPDEDNLALRAALTLRAALESHGESLPGIAIRLEKHIPMAAGLGGGSSDAAAVLSGLNALAEHPLPQAELMRIGGELGSDVPFFLTGASRALAWGRGERLLPLSPLPERPVLLAIPSPGVPTAWAYAHLAAFRASHGIEGPIPGILGGSGDDGWEEVAESATNDFEEALASERPELLRLKEALSEAGAGPALLSGSGSAVFGVFRDGAMLEHGAALVAERSPGVLLIRTHTLV